MSGYETAITAAQADAERICDALDTLSMEVNELARVNPYTGELGAALDSLRGAHGRAVEAEYELSLLLERETGKRSRSIMWAEAGT